MFDKFKSTGGLDAANVKLVNVADGDQAQDAVNIRVLDKKNTVQSHSTSRPYDLGFIVEYNGQLWKCTTAVSTPGVFNAASWTALAGRENWIRLTASYQAGVMDSLYVDAASAITITLPATPKSGDYVMVIDGAGLASQRPITIARNGTTINGAAADVTLNEDDVRCIFVYLGGTWKTLYTKVDRVKFTGSSAFTAISNLEYLIDVASNFTVTLPASPKVGDRVRLVDYNGGLGANTITVNGNSKQINGSANLLFSQKKGWLDLAYNGTQWIGVINAGADALLASKNLTDVVDKAAARAALELGTAAQQTMGTGSGEIRTNTQNDATYQPKDATLTAIAALVTAADKLIYSTGADQFAIADFTAQARTFLAAATQATQRSALGLGTAATMNMGTSIGELMQVGAFGLGSFTQLTNTPDLVTVTGLYTVPSTATGAPSPIQNSVMLHYEIASAVEVGAVQLAIDTNTVLYTRVRTGASTWGDWASIAPASSLGTAAYQDIGTEAGDVLGVGAFGLGAGAIMEMTDANNIIKSGFYVTAGAAANNPTVNGAYITCNSNGSTGVTHLGIDIVTNKMFYRKLLNGTWSSWIELYHSGNTGTAATRDVGTSAGNLVEVGAFGLGAISSDLQSAAIQDCDTATKNGWYVVSSTATNRPAGISSNNSGLFVFSDGANSRRAQFFTDAISGGSQPKIWIRQFDGSAWSPWIRFADEGVGEIVVSAYNVAVPGTLKANGAAVSRTTYARLFAKIGTTYGEGDGSTTFNLPDLRGEFIRGWDDGRGVDSGRAFGSGQGDAIRNITGMGGSSVAYGYSGVFYAGAARPAVGAGGSSLNDIMFDASRVVPTADENRPRNVAMLYCIRY